MNILLVEDEHRVRKYLEDALRAEGHSVTGCSNIEEVEAWMQVADSDPDVAILDRMLHDSDGITLIKPLRSRYPDCRILILSAMGIADEKAHALDQGADDYLSKPFSLNQLTARLRALSRRTSSKAAPTRSS